MNATSLSTSIRNHHGEAPSRIRPITQRRCTAPKARIPGYRVAGKTGTAYKIENGQYAKKYVASFVGFAPASDPRLIVAIMIDEPGGQQHFGGDVAGPVFANVMSGALRTLGVPPDIPVQVVAQAGIPKAATNKDRL